MRKEVEEIALMGGPDFVVQALVGTRRQLIGLTSGHPVAAYHAAVEQALKAYVTQKASNRMWLWRMPVV
jgi:nickel-dependent lactate racemase